MDEHVGSLWVDVGLRPKNIEKDVTQITSAAGKKIETFFDKYSKESFFDKYSRKASEKKVDLFLPSDKALQDAAAAKMSFLDRTMAGMGAKINKGGMMGAQLSYGLQDLATGLAMGNINMAVMGLSNNIGMMFMQISSAAGMWATLALVSIPMVITAVKALTGSEDKAKIAEDNLKQAIDRVNTTYARRIALLGQQAQIRHAGMPIEEFEIKTAGAAGSQIRTAQKDIEALTVDAQEIAKQKEQTIKEQQSRGVHVTSFDANLRQNALRALQNREREVEERFVNARTVVGRTMLHDAQQSLEDERKRIAIENNYDENHRAYITADGKLGIMRLKTQKEIVELENKAIDLDEKGGDIAAEIAANKAKIAELTKHHERLAREEVDFMKRRSAAGFNKYEQGKIDLEQQQKEAERELKERGLDKFVVKPGLTGDEQIKKQKEINDQAAKDQQDLADKRRNAEQTAFLVGGHRGKKFLEKFDKERDEIEAKRKKDIKETQRGDITLEDEAKAALDEDFRRRKLELAQSFTHGHTGVTSITGLQQQIQTGLLGGDKGIPIAEKTAANTAATAKATKDLLDWMKANPGGTKWGPN